MNLDSNVKGAGIETIQILSTAVPPTRASNNIIDIKQAQNDFFIVKVVYSIPLEILVALVVVR
ncbi:hypothetical protein K439DRAFT_1635197 [Ramaria rubella]|nr:hypothetical protein K439DRAFT_1635197 [Ramaria rubella]